MRFVVFLLTALCLSALSFSAAANVRAEAPAVEAMSALGDYATLTTGDDFAQIILPGDGGMEDDEAASQDPPPGYCNIWSADLLDPLDLLDEIEESSAIFDIPTFPLVLPSEDVAQVLAGRNASQPHGLFRPPNLLA